MGDESGHFDYNLYFVCLFDLLAQRNKLKDWERHPRTKEELERALHGMVGTVGIVTELRRALQVWLGETSSALEKIPEDDHARDKDKLLEELRPKFRIQCFSDTFMLIAPAIRTVSDGTNKIDFRRLQEILHACSYFAVHSLALGYPLRGAITVGTGVWIDDQWFYGPAVAEAHHLESEIAGYPRFVVSDSIVDLLDNGTYVFSAVTDPADALLMSFHRDLLIKDCDDVWILDFFQPGSLGLLWADRAEEACNFVESCAKRFANCSKLGPRYARLQRYMQQRIHLWRRETTGKTERPDDG